MGKCFFPFHSLYLGEYIGKKLLYQLIMYKLGSLFDGWPSCLPCKQINFFLSDYDKAKAVFDGKQFQFDVFIWYS